MKIDALFTEAKGSRDGMKEREIWKRRYKHMNAA